MNTIETPEGTIVTQGDRLEPVKSLAEKAGAEAINLANKEKMLKLFEKKMRQRLEKPLAVESAREP